MQVRIIVFLFVNSHAHTNKWDRTRDLLHRRVFTHDDMSIYHPGTQVRIIIFLKLSTNNNLITQEWYFFQSLS